MKRFSSVTLTTILILSFAFLGSCTNNDKPVAKNIIFLIGDGMGLHQMYAAHTVNGGPLAIESVSHVGLQRNHASNKYITDSAASGTALACGKKTNNGAIGVDPELNELESILKVAEKHGLATGLVSTSAITHATPAAFIANEEKRSNYEAIAEDFLKTDIDVFIGGGLDNFSKREDSVDLTLQLKENGYRVTSSIDELASVTSGKLAAFTADGHNPPVLKGRDDMLPIATTKALELLNQNENGFFIMIEGSQIDWGGHANDEEYVISETLDFDEAVKIALDFAKEDGETLVVITADHETGGMIVLNGDLEKKTIKTQFTTGGHTGMIIPVYAYGPGAELFTGVYENTDFKEKFMSAYGMLIEE